MKIFKNEKDGKINFATSAFKAAYNGKPEVKLSVPVNFSKGLEPKETVDAELKVTMNGKDYPAFLSAYEGKNGKSVVLVVTDGTKKTAAAPAATATPTADAAPVAEATVEDEDIDLDF